MGKWLTVFIFLVLFGTSPLGANPFLSGGSAPPNPSTASPVPQFLVDLQLSFKTAAADLIDQLASKSDIGLVLSLLAAAFLYGLVHALAPGHQKTVVFSLFLGRSEPGWKPMAAGFLTTGVHTGSSLLLIGVLSLIQAGVARLVEVDAGGRWIEFTSAVVLVILALALIIRKVIHIFGHKEHSHGIKVKDGSLWMVLAAASAIPCTGATMLMLMALYADLLWLGILGVVAMSLGMGIVVSASGYLAWAGRSALFNKMKGREGLIHNLTEGLELFSYLILLLLALLILF